MVFQQVVEYALQSACEEGRLSLLKYKNLNKWRLLRKYAQHCHNYSPCKVYIVFKLYNA
jgi:hypothetical protein